MLHRIAGLPVRSRISEKQTVAFVQTANTRTNANATLLSKTMAAQDAVRITAPPAAGQEVEHDRKVFTTVKEGKAYILVPPKARTSVDPQTKSKAGEHVYYPLRSTFHVLYEN